jgi:hypothetical protein
VIGVLSLSFAVSERSKMIETAILLWKQGWMERSGEQSNIIELATLRGHCEQENSSKISSDPKGNSHPKEINLPIEVGESAVVVGVGREQTGIRPPISLGRVNSFVKVTEAIRVLLRSDWSFAGVFSGSASLNRLACGKSAFL